MAAANAPLRVPRSFRYENLDAPYALSRPALVKRYHPEWSAQDIDNYLSQKRTFTSHVESHRSGFNPHYITHLRQRLEADLIVFPPTVSHPRYILTVCDVFSRFLFTEFCERKNGKTVTEKFQKIYKRMGGRRNIRTLATDSGR